jgi:hypothetical protein
VISTRSPLRRSRLGLTLAVDVDAAALDGFGRERAALDETGGPQPAVDADAVWSCLHRPIIAATEPRHPDACSGRGARIRLTAFEPRRLPDDLGHPKVLAHQPGLARPRD